MAAVPVQGSSVHISFFFIILFFCWRRKEEIKRDEKKENGKKKEIVELWFGLLENTRRTRERGGHCCIFEAAILNVGEEK